MNRPRSQYDESVGAAGFVGIVGKLIGWGFVVLLALLVIYPLIWMVVSGFKSNQEIFASPWGLPSQWRWGNYQEAWNLGIVRYLTNSVIVTTVSVVTTTLISAWAAYGLTRVRIPFGNAIVLVILGGLMLAPTVALIPLFRLLQNLHIFDTYLALIVLYTAFRIPFTTFLIRAYMIELPMEVDEAAFIDGASRTQIFWRVIMPMSKPILISAALLQALFAWNEYVFALVFINSEKLKTLPVGLVSMQSRLLTDWPIVFASLTLAALPMVVVFLLGQRHFLRGLTDGVGK
jgi:raffinose/stachyose/melibiose transport system permease protein